MALRFVCPGCAKRYEVPESRVGKRASCLKCRRMLRLPAELPADGAWVRAAEISAPAKRKAAAPKPDPDEEEIIDAEPVFADPPAPKPSADEEFDVHPDWPEDMTFDLDEYEAAEEEAAPRKTGARPLTFDLDEDEDEDEEEDLVPLELVTDGEVVEDARPAEPTREITIVIGRELFDEVNDRAIAGRRTFDEAVEAALKAWLKRR